ncbi:MAG: DsrE family protein [Desulfofustis sp.]|nr:DsrE family protein [Desulfofustis sp.]
MMVRFAVLCILLVSGALSAGAAQFDNARALAGVDRVGIYFDVNIGNADLLALRMRLIEQTLDQLRSAGIETDVVIGIRGGATSFTTRDDHYVLDDEVAAKQAIQEHLRSFAARGVVIEQCEIAAVLKDIPVADFIDEVIFVGNGYVSLIGYQARGYAVVPMD